MANLYTCLARNSMPRLADNLYNVYYNLMKEDDELLIVENDSTDFTKTFLRDFYTWYSRIHLLMSDENAPRFGSVVSLERAERLAVCRNKYLKFAKEREKFEYLVVFDSDMHTLPSENFDTMFTEHAAVSSNGLLQQKVRLPDGRIGIQEIYYDSWAYLHLTEDVFYVGGDENTHTTTFYNPQPKFEEQDELLEVRSGFGGLAVYKMDAIKDCEYHPFGFHGKKAALGEQGGFTEDIRKNGGQVFINTNYQPIVNA